jgi:TonB family protein
MSVYESNNPLDLLRQTPALPRAVELHGATEPRLALAWGEFHQGIGSNFSELFRRARVPKDFLAGNFFRSAWIERRLPRRAIFAAALWHIAILAMPFPQISGPKRNPAFANTQISWSGPIEDFPLIEIPAARPKPRAPQIQPAVPEGSDAFHPRQRIFADPVHPTHPRQTLIHPAAPPEPPKILPALPNLVQLAQSAAPARPQLEISQDILKKLRPREKRIAANPTAVAPEVQLSEQRVADLNLAVSNAGPERPKLQINAGVAPRVSQRKQDSTAESAPDVAETQLTSSNGSGQTLISLSGTPGPPAAVAPPAGNVAARVAISPEGKTPGVSATPNPNSGSGSSSTGISISGAAPHNTNNAAGISTGKIAMPSSRPNYSRAEASRAQDEPSVQTTTTPNFAALAPDAKPEAIFARRRVYSMNVNMPNLNSATGSWILNFSEMRTPATGPQTSSSPEIAEPAPVRKVDPKYPPTLAAEHVEGEVILYAVIRRDGSVDSIQVVRGIDAQLDANAMRALAQWKFRPAERQGEPVDLEAIVHIPFHALAD